jgi:FkbM family methyltransferase
MALDLGANIGLFSLLAARTHPTLRIFAYEPGPENVNLFRMNVLANPELNDRITVIPKGISGNPGKASWTFDPDNPGGSGFFGKGPRTTEVEVVSLQQVIQEHRGQSLFVKMDIEGSEFEVIRATPASSWEPVQALTFELHDDPLGSMSSDAFLAAVGALGFQIEKKDVISYFAYKK